MKRKCAVLTILATGCILLLHTGCQKQVQVTEKPPFAMKQTPQATDQNTAGHYPERLVPDFNRAGIVASKAAKNKPKISFENMVYDFGQVDHATSNVGELEFENTGNAPLMIMGIPACCGVTAQLKNNKNEYAPGEKGAVVLTFNTLRFRGQVTKAIQVFSNDPAQPQLLLTLKAEVVRKVRHEPEELRVFCKGDSATCPNITLKSIDNQPFAIKSFQATGDCITASFDPSAQAAQFVLEPRADAEKLKVNLSGSIRIELTHPQCDSLVIPFTVQQQFTVNPLAVMIFDAEPQKPVKRDVWITNNYNEDFQIESISSKEGYVKVLGQDKRENRYELHLEINPPPIEGRKKFFVDELYVNLKGGQQLVVPCRGVYTAM